jgi:hypothetical protein
MTLHTIPRGKETVNGRETLNKKWAKFEAKKKRSNMTSSKRNLVGEHNLLSPSLKPNFQLLHLNIDPVQFGAPHSQATRIPSLAFGFILTFGMICPAFRFLRLRFFFCFPCLSSLIVGYADASASVSTSTTVFPLYEMKSYDKKRVSQTLALSLR